MSYQIAAALLLGICTFFGVVGFRLYREQTSWIARRSALLVEDKKKSLFAGLEETAAKTGLNIEPAHILLVIVAGALLGAAAGLAVTGRKEFALLGLVTGAAAPSAFVKWQVEGRKKAFEMQLEQCLLRMAAAMRAGMSVVQALEDTALWAKPPAQEVLARAVAYLHTGHSLPRAVELAAKTVDSKELELTASSISLHYTVGGNLADVFERIAENIREKQSFRSRLAAATAEGRLTANVLAALPFIGVAFMRKLSPAYMDPLFNSPGGIKVFIGCSAAIALGYGMLKRITTDIEY